MLVSIGPVGADGTVPTVFDADAVDAAPVPPAFVAVTVTVYAVPFVNVVMLHVVAGAVAVHVPPPLLAVAVYVVVAPAVPAAPAVQETPSVPDVPFVVVTPVGAAGKVPGAFEFEAAELVLFPLAFVATTVNVYDVALVSPVKSHVVVGAMAVQVMPPGEVVAV